MGSFASRAWPAGFQTCLTIAICLLDLTSGPVARQVTLSLASSAASCCQSSVASNEAAFEVAEGRREQSTVTPSFVERG